jgi:cytoskeletal protein CcmA (bactofilin family)
MKTAALVTVAITCMCMLTACLVCGTPLEFGSLDDEAGEKREKAEAMIMSLGMGTEIDDEDIVRIGSGYAVDEDEIVEGDVVVIGGGLTVEGTIEGDAVVIGGSMYLASTATIEGDAAVVSGIIEMEDGAVVLGDILESPEIMRTSRDVFERQERAEELREKTRQMELAKGVRGEIIKFASDIHVAEDELVEGDVVAIGGDITIEGTVTGDVVTTGGDIYVTSTAEVQGDIAATFGEVTIEAGALIEGEVIEVDMGGARKVKTHMPPKWEWTGEEVTYLVSLYRPHADDVRLTGSWIGWDEDGIRMKRDEEGNWKTRITLGPGSYSYKFIVDGRWIPDPDIEDRVPDGRGGYATPLIVKGRAMKKEVDGQTIIFSFDRPHLYDVRVTGSWMDWDDEGIPMTPDEDGKWSVAIPLPAGFHAYRFYLNDEWMPDPDVDKMVEDRMGGWATPVVVNPRGKDKGMIKFLHDRPDVDDMRITGDWTDWDPKGLPMYKGQDGVWYTYVALRPGTHEYKFYIDGRWVADPDSPEKRVPDGKGGYMTRFTVKSPRKRAVTVRTGLEKTRGIDGIFDYNRVDGVYAGLTLTNRECCFPFSFPFPQFYVEGGYSFKRERWLYKFALEQPIAAKNTLSLGGAIYDKTESYDTEIVTDWENLIVASLLKQDYKDYFDLRGVTGFAALRPWKGHMVKVSYSADEFRPLETRVHTALFRKDDEFRPNPRNSYQICDADIYDGARVCDKIEVRSLAALYELDVRDDEKCCAVPSSGHWIRLMGEWARTDWGGELSYNRYWGDARQYHQVSPKQRVNMRFKAGFLEPTDECPCVGIPDIQYFFPKQFYVGGIGTLPGYGYKQFRGTHMVLANLEYQYTLKGDLSIVFFSDAGDAKGEVPTEMWDKDELWDDMRIKFDAGIAFRHEEPGEHSVTLGVAKGLTKLYDDDERPVIVTVRAGRMF